MVSAVAFGTSQLRVVPEREVIDTLIKGFELGVNLVHVAPDYEGAEAMLARAIRESPFGSKVLICTQAYDVHGNSSGPVQHFERLFEQSCRIFDRECIDLYGIACIDDRENFGENVWGSGGMVEFLTRKKQEGRIRATFCTTHGGPDFIRRLLLADVFDALLSDRCYRPAMNVNETVAIIEEGRGTQFDPEIVDVLVDCLEDVLRLRA